MKKICLPVVLALAFLPLLSAQEALPPSAPPAGHGEKHDDSPLHKEMEALNRNMRKLSRQYSDAAQKESSLKLVSEMLANSEAAKTMIPSQVAKLPEADQAKALEIYHKDMDTLSTELTTLKELITAGDAVAIKAQLDKLNDVKKSGHKDLGVKKGGPGGDRPHGPGPEEVH